MDEELHFELQNKKLYWLQVFQMLSFQTNDKSTLQNNSSCLILSFC